MRLNLLLIGLVGLIVFLASGAWNPDSFGTWGKDPEPERITVPKQHTSNTDKLYAFRLARTCVKDKLLDPEPFFANNGRAQLPTVSGRAPWLKVASYVRTRNRLGGWVHRNWVAEVNVDTGHCVCEIIE